ncbi:MAG: 3-oxoacyl-[acyl-carrier-protein] synthase III C-terminal domain-containing protein, partial [SAR202 cluster bacterium]|nr:3-oxoacyl-[acyl-carrier-protein] synthase III C-terminal domain-containing protein [SAR202 cluster bacterium]
LVRLRTGGSSFPFSKESLKEENSSSLYFEHMGLGVWKEVIVKLPQIINNALNDLNWKIDDISLFLMHQANMNLINYIVKKLKIPSNKTMTNVQDIGNTGDASVGTILYDAKKSGLLKKNSKIILASVGAGFVYAVTPYIVFSE